MKISRRFKVQENEGYGELGFLPTWIKGADPFRRVAHDMLEHFLVPQCNAAEAELMALGAMLVIRIDGARNPGMSAEENLALVVDGAMNDWASDSLDEPQPLATRRMREHDWAENVIVAAVPKAFGMHGRNFDGNPPFLNTLQPTVVSWLRAGVRAAYRRYAGYSGGLFTLGDYVMPKLDDFSDKLLRELDEGAGEVVITADIDACEFSATVNGKRLWPYTGKLTGARHGLVHHHGRRCTRRRPLDLRLAADAARPRAALVVAAHHGRQHRRRCTNDGSRSGQG